MAHVLFVCLHNAGRSQMSRALFDLAGRTPRKLTTADAEWADVVVTMGCGDECPYIPGKRYLDWDLEDPKGQSLEAVRETRDEIERRVRALVAELDGAGPGA